MNVIIQKAELVHNNSKTDNKILKNWDGPSPMLHIIEEIYQDFNSLS